MITRYVPLTYMRSVQSKGVSLICAIQDIKKALMLCIKAFPCRRSGEKVECKSNRWTRSGWVNYCPVRPWNGLNFLFGNSEHTFGITCNSMIPMFSVSSRNKDKEMFMTGSQEVVGSNPVFSTKGSLEPLNTKSCTFKNSAMGTRWRKPAVSSLTITIYAEIILLFKTKHLSRSIPWLLKNNH